MEYVTCCAYCAQQNLNGNGSSQTNLYANGGSKLKGLAAQGKSAAEIAAVVGSTPASVRVRCSQFKIKLARPHFGSRRNELQPVSKRKLVVYLPPSVHAAMTRKAQDMRKSTVELAESLLRAIVNSNLYEAVLDEAE